MSKITDSKLQQINNLETNSSTHLPANPSTDTVIKVENVSKKFCKSLKRSMIYGMQDISRNILGLNSKSDKLKNNEFWALNEISFELKRGETLGIIGPNGSGKTTLLKLLNGIFWPDKGKITIKGRVGALIEVGAGFHPMLTGRENIYVNAAILGMRKKEVDKKFDDIIEFADIGDFIDSPVKKYSSGMFVRLGFAIAVHCEPDILLIDEILAVGDLSFQARCRKKIQEMREKGITIFLVSHNMHTINHLCNKAMTINCGKQIFIGETERAIDIYKEIQIRKQSIHIHSNKKEIEIADFKILNKKGVIQNDFKTGNYIKFRIYYKANTTIQNPVFNIAIYSSKTEIITGIRTDVDNIETGAFSGTGYVDLIIKNFNLLPDVYRINATIFHSCGFEFYDRIEQINHLRIIGGQNVHGNMFLPHTWFFNSGHNSLEI
jgi:lipopolysaccharide transport system ATP-binding protein